MTGTLHEDQYTFMTLSRPLLRRMKNIWDKSCRENQNTHFVFNNFFLSLKSCRLWHSVENIVELGRPQMIICRMGIACWIPKATNTLSQYVTHIAYPRQQWLHERVSILRRICIACLVLYLVRALHTFHIRFVIIEQITTKCDLWKVIQTLLTSSVCFLLQLN
jgi:hypothetical protein